MGKKLVTVILVIAAIEGMHVYILVALVCNSCADLTELILNVQKYSDKWLWSQLKIIHSYCFSIIKNL